jgi:hypothetical protein
MGEWLSFQRDGAIVARYDLFEIRHSIIESVRTPARIRPYPTGRLLLGGAFPGTSCLATIMLSLRDEIHSPPKLRKSLLMPKVADALRAIDA